MVAEYVVNCLQGARLEVCPLTTVAECPLAPWLVRRQQVPPPRFRGRDLSRGALSG